MMRTEFTHNIVYLRILFKQILRKASDVIATQINPLNCRIRMKKGFINRVDEVSGHVEITKSKLLINKIIVNLLMSVVTLHHHGKWSFP